MRNKEKLMRGQSGQILLYTTIIVMLAALILVPLMQFAFTSHRSAQIREERTLELYASDAGIEDALYQIKTEQKGTDLANLGFGDTSAYNPGTPGMNDRTMDVSVQKVWIPQDLAGNLKTDTPVDSTTPSLDTDKSDKLVVVGMLKTIQAAAASDDFTSLSGGTGSWTTGSWTITGGASLGTTAAEGCGSGNYLKLADVPSTATRTANLLKYMKPQLKFSAKASSLEAGDTVYLKVKYDNGEEKIVETWGDGNESSGCNAFSIDLSDLYDPDKGNTSVPLQVAFDANLSTVTVAHDDFENGFPSGYLTEWSGAWSISSSTYCTIQTSGGFCNSKHLRLQRANYSAWRKVDLSTYGSPHLKFYFKTEGYDNTSSDHDYAYVDVSKDGGSHWTTVWTWSGGTRAYPSCGTLQDQDVDLTSYASSQFVIRFRGNAESNEYFDVDNISITEGDSFYVDNLWIGDEYNSNTIEIAYTDPNFDLTAGSPGINDPAFLDRIGVWMPPGCHYVSVVGNQTTVELYKEPPTTILSDTYAGGTIVEWDYGNVALHQPPGGIPIVKTLTFAYAADVTQSVEGMFTWIAVDRVNNGPPNLVTDPLDDYVSWDKGYEIYKAVSQAHSEIYGSNTQVTAYASQGEIDKKGAASYGDYVATGNALLIDYTGSSQVKEQIINPSDPYTWVTKDGFLYDGRSDITSIPSDAEVVAGWLYWSAFMNNSDWGTGNSSFGDKVTTGNVTASFMYPKRYGPETFAVHAGDGNDAYTTFSWASTQEPMDLLAHEPVLTLSQVKYVGEVLGNATAGHGNDTFWTAHQNIQSPAPIVKVNNVTRSQSGNYTINYATGNVTIINDALSGPVTIDYWAAGSMKLTEHTDYEIIHPHDLGSDIRYEGFTVGNDNLQGTVTIDYYYAKHWENLTHAAYDKYGTVLYPAQTEVTTPSDGHVGHSYACFDDVTELLTGNGAYDFIGKGQYAVGDVKATPGVDGSAWDTRSFSGWSLIVLYKSATETAHQFYLYDPIHNAADCPFQVRPVTDYSPQPEYINVPFTLKDFHPPEGTVEGRTTYFVGEGDVGFQYDYVGFKGASQPSYTYLDGVYNPQDNVMNCKSTTGEMGIDIDTYPILDEVGSDTEANVNLRTKGDRWYLVYMILSFKTNEVPKEEYAFNVASVTYQYELGAK